MAKTCIYFCPLVTWINQRAQAKERTSYTQTNCNSGLYRIQISNIWKRRLWKSIALWLKMDFPSTLSMESVLMGIFSMLFKKWQSNAFISLYIWKLQQKSCNYFKFEFHKPILVAKIDNHSSYTLKIRILYLGEPASTEIPVKFTSSLKRRKQLMFCHKSYIIYSKYYSTLVYMYF